MCGFAGFVGEVDDREQVLVNMMNTIVHRGPDSAGKYVDEDAALGFRAANNLFFFVSQIAKAYIPRRRSTSFSPHSSYP